MLIINNITKSFGSKKILDHISLSIKPGHIALFLGQSGVGKSTLLRILSGLEKEEEGAITFEGQPLNSFNHQMVGMVFQGFNLFDHMSVERNITLPLEKVSKISLTEAQLRAHKLLSQYGLEDKKYNYPSQLSGGQKQRLAIARALSLEPRIICLDEPTSALDPLLTASVAHNIQKLAHQGYVVLVASHDADLLKRLHCTIYLMQEGKIIEHGFSDDIKNNPLTYPRINAFIAGHQST